MGTETRLNYYLHDGQAVHLQRSAEGVVVHGPPGKVLKGSVEKWMAQEGLGSSQDIIPLWQEGQLLLPIKPEVSKELLKSHSKSNFLAVKAFSLGPDVFDTPDGSRLIPDGHVNAYLQGRSEKQIRALLEAFKATLVQGPSSRFPFHVLRPLKGDAFQLANTLATEEPPTLAQPRFESLLKVSLLPTRNPPGLELSASRMWGLNRIGIPSVWRDFTRGSPDIRVAVIDCGVDLEHPDLRGNLLPGYSLFEKTAQPFNDPANAHGTACAGIIAASGKGATGVAPGCKLLPIRIGIIKKGYFNCGPQAMAEAISLASEKGAQVINLSLTEPSPTSAVHQAIDDVVHHPDKKKRCVVGWRALPSSPSGMRRAPCASRAPGGTGAPRICRIEVHACGRTASPWRGTGPRARSSLSGAIGRTGLSRRGQGRSPAQSSAAMPSVR
ncbi:S8 family serine peptidase [Hyalangium sp.]|uniref:S8 family serine peptidase n=1 Tax=Hyalangium sp. TaxID=2028555 RepID=UPI002D4350B8|nr:S8 family serine peptidase [Hyalangium sp.]HYI00694.1 S8 family serine peptidase [Hyalangium sp.]